MPSTILVIDDSLTIRKLLEMSLTSAGHLVQLAANAADGLALARRLRPRLILLDHILPDRKGAEVCADLSADPTTSSIPIIVMSAKGDDIRPLFRDRPSVVACIGKPFAPSAITHLVGETLGPVQPTQPSTARIEPPTASFRPQDPATAAAAQTMFAALRERLAMIPTWANEVGTHPPASFFARRLLTPETVSKLLDGIAPLISPPPAAAPAPADHLLQGNTSILDVPGLLRLLRELGRTGILRIGQGERSVELFCERGDTIMAVPIGELGIQAAAAAGLPPPETAGADGTPAIVMSATQSNQPTDALYRIGVNAILTLTATGPQPFLWQPLQAMPETIHRHGRSITAEQLALERLRLVDDWTQIEAEVASLEQVCMRSPDAIARLRQLNLSEIERRVLTEINGRRNVRQLLDRCGLSTFELFHVLYRLIQCRLVLPRQAVVPAMTGRPPVLVAGPDSRLADPLHRILTTRGLAPSPVANETGSLVRIISESQAQVVMIDADTCDAATIAQSLRSVLETSAITVVAITDRQGAQAGLSTSCDLVLTAPVHADDIPSLLGF